jgi:hypothetical protein
MLGMKDSDLAAHLGPRGKCDVEVAPGGQWVTLTWSLEGHPDATFSFLEQGGRVRILPGATTAHSVAKMAARPAPTARPN